MCWSFYRTATCENIDSVAGKEPVPPLMMAGRIEEGQNKQYMWAPERDGGEAAIDPEPEVFGPDLKRTCGKPAWARRVSIDFWDPWPERSQTWSTLTWVWLDLIQNCSWPEQTRAERKHREPQQDGDQSTSSCSSVMMKLCLAFQLLYCLTTLILHEEDPLETWFWTVGVSCSSRCDWCWQDFLSSLTPKSSLTD